MSNPIEPADWRALRKARQNGRQRRAEARYNAIGRYVEAGVLVEVMRLGPHGVRLAAPHQPEFRVDYWPGSGCLQVVGAREPSGYGVALGGVLRALGIDRREARRRTFGTGGEHGGSEGREGGEG